MLFSRACEHAIRAILYVAAYGDGGPVPVRDIARNLDLPFAALAKIVQTLCRNKLLVSYKGRGGGIELARSAEAVTLQEVVEVIEGPDYSRECVLGIPGCSEDTVHCPLHESWGPIREQIHGMLGDRSIASFAQDLQGPGFALTRHGSGGKDA
jgi:Rrf2 family protein